jgi:hypothetical protein
MHQWPLRRAAPQYQERGSNGSKGPFMPMDTKGGEPPFAAVCTKVSYAQIAYFAKSHERPKH